MNWLSPIKNRFCIDESGNSGDAVFKHGAAGNFNNQPIFSLGCVGISRIENNLNEEVSRLKSKYRIQSSELKAGKIYDRKPEFLRELVSFLVQNEYPIFIELMDKKFYISTQIVTSLLLPPSPAGLKLDERYLYIANVFAEVIFESLEDRVFSAFCDTCLVPTEYNFCQLLDVVSNAIDQSISKPYFKEIKQSFMLTLDDYHQVKSKSQTLADEVHKQFLPIPDYNKRNEILAMLPHIPAFTNLYARINRYISNKGNIDEIILTHDEQAHFDELLKSYKFDLDSNKYTEQLRDFPNFSVNYDFSKNAIFEFENSKDVLGLQVADLLAGLCMRYFSDHEKGEKERILRNKEAFSLIANESRKSLSLGVNMVTSLSKSAVLFSMQARV